MRSSAYLKTAAFWWLRFGRQLPWVTSECGAYSADVLGADADRLVEIEVKVSKADFKRDFTAKTKHEKYSRTELYNGGWVPHFFYFLVPEEMAEWALEQLAKFPVYGLIVFRDHPSGFVGNPGERLEVVRKAKRLHKTKPPEKVLLDIAKRMSSELCHLHLNQILYADYRQMLVQISNDLSDRTNTDRFREPEPEETLL